MLKCKQNIKINFVRSALLFVFLLISSFQINTAFAFQQQYQSYRSFSTCPPQTCSASDSFKFPFNSPLEACIANVPNASSVPASTDFWFCRTPSGSTSYRASLYTPPNATCSNQTCSCNSGFVHINGSCQQQVTCNSTQFNNTTTNTCEPKQSCGGQNPVYNPQNNTCGQCSANTVYDQPSGTCIPKPTCNNNDEIYQSSSNSCVKNTECGTNNIIGNSASCTCTAGSLTVKRFNVVESKYYCSGGTAADQNAALAALAAAIGLSVATMTGLFAGIGACLASIVCAASLSVVGLASALGLGGLVFDANTADVNPQQTANAPLTVDLAPSDKTCPSGSICISPDGDVRPPSDAQLNANGKYSPPGKPDTEIDTTTGTITHKETNGQTTTSTVITATAGSYTVDSVSSTPYGTSNGQQVTAVTPTRTTVNSRSGTATKAVGDINYCFSGQCNTAPPQGTQIDPNYSGQPNTPSGSGAGDCDKEPAKCALLTNINNTLRGFGTDGVTVLNGFSNTITTSATQFDQYFTDSFNTFINGIQIPEALSPQGFNVLTVMKSAGNNCSMDVNVSGYHALFSYCEYQPTIHTAIAFFGFIFLLSALRNLIYERPLA